MAQFISDLLHDLAIPRLHVRDAQINTAEHQILTPHPCIRNNTEASGEDLSISEDKSNCNFASPFYHCNASCSRSTT